MKTRHAHTIKIYQPPLHSLHFAVTLFFVVLPFLALLLFSRLAHIASGRLLLDVLISSWRMLVAYLIAVILGWIFAVAFYRGKKATIALPFFDVLQSFPSFALLPLVIFTWGTSSYTVIFFLVLAIIWPIFFSIISSLKLIRQDWQEVAEIFDVKGIMYIKKFLIPVSFPGLITGSIVGLGDGWEVLIATEIIVGMRTGIGNFFQSFSHNPTVTVFGILGFLLFVFTINKFVWLKLLEWSHRKMEE